MHAHYHTTSKLSRKIGPRRAVVRGLVDSLILYERIVTTQAKAKVLVPEFDRLVTRAKKGRLIDTRYIFAHTNNPIAAQKLLYELTKGLADRTSGYTRITKLLPRRGDNAPMVCVEIILPADFNVKKEEAAKATKINETPKSNVATDKKASTKKEKTEPKKTRKAAA